jgi:MOSC domain-containing protein YiiM
MAEASRELLTIVMGLFHAAGLPVCLFGGWAEELRGLIRPRPHSDIDLLYRASSFDALEAFMSQNPAFSEIEPKRFSHKRAARFKGVMIEFLLVQDSPMPCTVFFDGRFRLAWPGGTFEQPVLLSAQPLPAASAEALRLYRAQHIYIQQAYQQHRDGSSTPSEENMQIISVNIGEERAIHAKSSGKTGIYKIPASAPVEVTPLGLQGDVIIDVENHGGPGQAVYVYFSPDYAWWAAELGTELLPGTFGENLTISTLESARLAIGDRLITDQVTLEVTCPRIPCVTLAARMGDPTFVKRFRTAERPGVYCRVIRPGLIQAGEAVTYQPYTGEILTALEMYRDYYEGRNDEATIRRHLAVPIAERDRVHREEQLRALQKPD